jgi:signal transduction histidine kinase
MRLARKIRALPAAAATAAMALAAMLALSISAVRASQTITRNVEQLSTVRAIVADLLHAVVDTDESQRALLVSGLPEYAKRREDARRRVAESIERLRTYAPIPPNNPTQALERSASARIAVLDAILETRVPGAAGAAGEALGADHTMEALLHEVEATNADLDRFLRDGREARRRANVHAIVALVATGYLFGLLAVLVVTWRRAAEAERAQLAERAHRTEFQERFIAILGHDLRNPLSAVRMGLTLLKRTAPNESLGTIDRMNRSVVRMDRMIQQLLDLARSRMGGIRIATAPTSLERIVSDVADELRSAYPGRELVVESAGDLDGAWDADRLQQVASNLINNALCYGPPDEPVRVALRGEDGRVVLSVHNGGPPIADATREALFDPFRRTKGEAPARPSGLGLGLYISRELVRAHGGRIDLQSTSSSGTTFTVELPRAAGDTGEPGAVTR